ncbi:preprotein translocase subunit Sec61beta [Halobacteriales archaeon QS_1_68_20]|nr:MAG: preprotein translocase subunit Sec61beta [Halobacteriales archaeon QS_1_68_20]
MAKKDDSGGLMSSAGLVRYFDSEDQNAIRIDPKTVVAWAVLFGVLVQVINAVGIGGGGSIVLWIVIAAFGGLTVGMVVKAAIQGEV